MTLAQVKPFRVEFRSWPQRLCATERFALTIDLTHTKQVTYRPCAVTRRERSTHRSQKIIGRQTSHGGLCEATAATPEV